MRRGGRVSRRSGGGEGGGREDREHDAVQAIQGITGTIGRMSEIATAIASSLDQRSAATQEIARGVQEFSVSPRKVSSHFAGVHHSAEEAGTASKQLLTSAASVSQSGDALRPQVDGSLRELRAA